MLRITQRNDCLTVEGSITGAWVGELRRAAEDCLSRQSATSLDLSGVSFVDAEGATLLRSLIERRMSIRASSPFVSAVLTETRS